MSIVYLVVKISASRHTFSKETRWLELKCIETTAQYAQSMLNSRELQLLGIIVITMSLLIAYLVVKISAVNEHSVFSGENICKSTQLQQGSTGMRHHNVIASKWNSIFSGEHICKSKQLQQEDALARVEMSPDHLKHAQSMLISRELQLSGSTGMRHHNATVRKIYATGHSFSKETRWLELKCIETTAQYAQSMLISRELQLLGIIVTTMSLLIVYLVKTSAVNGHSVFIGENITDREASPTSLMRAYLLTFYLSHIEK